MTLQAVLPVADIHDRLEAIFPEGSPNHDHATWMVAAKTVFVMLYAGAVEGTDQWLRPDQVNRMTDDQAARTGDAERRAWVIESMRASKGEIPGRWYATNTRESVRDDTIRGALIPNGAVIERAGLPTTSPAPRYALSKHFVTLLSPSLAGEALASAISGWQTEHMNAGALARIAMVRKGVVSGGDVVLVRFPSGETRNMAPGTSSLISKAVIEEFAPRFLGQPGVVFLSESKHQVIARDETLARAIGLNIQADRNLPDIVLVDLAPQHPLLVFVEVVATDGPISQPRKVALTELAKHAGFPPDHITFVTAYLDRAGTPFKRTVASLAWGAFAWFAAEPERLVRLDEGGTTETAQKLSDWLG